jgi:hypothetical protein
MFRRILQYINSFFSLFINRSSTINNEPVNKVSLVVIILIDIFILTNVFTGLADISNWHLSPSQAFPCYQEWNDNKTSKASNKKYEFIIQAISNNALNKRNYKQTYLNLQKDHLGKVSDICLSYGELKDRVNTANNKLALDNINDRSRNIDDLKTANQNIRSQYDSTLLEEIAKQNRTDSINKVSAARAKQELEQNNQKISKLGKEISSLSNDLINKPESINFINFTNDNTKFNLVESGYKNAAFWYPSIQISLQSLFLLPLIAIALTIHNYANRRGFGLVSLISWHLLVIFLIPLLLKIFEFLQVGIIFKFIFDIVEALFGGLLFLISYVYIFVIPLVGFLIIKFFQKITSNPKGKVVTRVQKYQCIRCAKKIRLNDLHCPYCGFEQFIDCENCQTSTYRSLPYCKQCGYKQSS